MNLSIQIKDRYSFDLGVQIVIIIPDLIAYVYMSDKGLDQCRSVSVYASNQFDKHIYHSLPKTKQLPLIHILRILDYLFSLHKH